MSLIKKNLSTNRGIALVLVLSILVLVSIFVTFFTSQARAELKKTLFYKNGAKALYLAEGGLHRAIYELKFHPTSGHAAAAGSGIDAQDTKEEDWFYSDGPNSALEDSTNPSFSGLYGAESDVTEEIAGIGQMKLKVVDSASLINLNSTDEMGLRLLLGNLLNGLLSSTEVDDIITTRSSYTNGYKRIQDIKSIIEEGKFEQVESYLTVQSFIDKKLLVPGSPNEQRYFTVATGNRRAPVNVNTADVEVLKAVLRNLSGISISDGENLASNLENYTENTPFRTWRQFNSYIDNNPSNSFLTQTEKDRIKDAVNPNKPKDPAAPPQEYSTEFTFASDGYFEIESLGEITNSVGQILAKRSLKTSVKIYDIFRISTRDDFVGHFDTEGNVNINHDAGSDNYPNIVDDNLNDPVGPLDDRFGERGRPGFLNVTWFDSTPIDPDDDEGFRYKSFNTREVIPGAIKLGFWDNFDESTDESSIIWASKTAFWSGSSVSLTSFEDVGTSGHWQGGSSSTHPARDPNDKELWQPFSDNPFDDSPPYSDTSQSDDRTMFALAGFYDPFNHSDEKNTYRKWDDDLYLRIFNSDGPRTTRTEDGNKPGIASSDLAGRDYTDIGYLMSRMNLWRPFREKANMFGLSTTGNYYDEEEKYDTFNPTETVNYRYDMSGNGNIGERAAIREIIPTLYFPNGTMSYWTSGSDRILLTLGVTLPTPFQFEDSSALPVSYPQVPNRSDWLNEIYTQRDDPFIWDDDATANIFQSNLFTNSSPERDKTYRLIIENNTATSQVILDGGSYQTLFTQALGSYGFGQGSDTGSLALYGKSSHPAWDDVRIIGKTGSYTTAAFTPGDINSDDNNTLWGTFSWTETFDASADSSPDLIVTLLFADGDASQIQDNLSGTPVAESYQYPGANKITLPGSGEGGPIRNGGGAVSYPNDFVRIFLDMSIQDVWPSSGKAPEIPVFEDATLTYLKETQIFHTYEN